MAQATSISDRSNDLFAGQDWDKDQLQRWAWDGRVQGCCHQVGWNWIGSFPCESHGSLESFSWATLLMLKLITGAARMGLRWLRSSFTKPSLNSQGSDNHRLDLHCLKYDCCIRVETVVLEVPSRNVGRVIGRRGETVKKKSSFHLALLHLANPYTMILLDLLLICSGEGHQQGEQMQSGRGVRNQGWNC